MWRGGVIFIHGVAVALFQRVVADDAESYLCYARNKFGSNSATGELVVLSKIFVLFFLSVMKMMMTVLLMIEATHLLTYLLTYLLNKEQKED